MLFLIYSGIGMDRNHFIAIPSSRVSSKENTFNTHIMIMVKYKGVSCQMTTKEK